MGLKYSEAIANKKAGIKTTTDSKSSSLSGGSSGSKYLDAIKNAKGTTKTVTNTFKRTSVATDNVTKDDNYFLNKFSKSSVTDIDELLNKYSNTSPIRLTKDELNEFKWLKDNRDSFMSTADLQNEIATLEDNSGKLKSEKLNSGVSYLLSAIGESPTSVSQPKKQYNADSAAVSENQARLKKLYGLLADREDFDVESAYKEADDKNLFDVLSPDYSIADYRNDQTKKNVYASAITERKDSENNKLIESNNELQNDIAKFTTILSNRKSVSSAMSDNIFSFITDSVADDEIIQTTPELQNIINKWSAKGYDFEGIYDSFKRKSNAEHTQAVNKQQEDFTEKHPVLGSIASVAGNVVSNIAAAPEILATGLKDATSNEIVNLDINSPAWALKNATDTIRETTSKMINEKAKTDWGGQLGNFFYQTGMSLADMGASYLAGGFNPTAYSLLMSSTAAVDKIKTVTENGGSVDEALLSGLVAGGLEAIFERVGIDNLVENITSATGKGILKSFFKSSLSEGLEELGTDITNSIADAIINGDNSEFNNSVYDYMNNGYSAASAQAAALTDVAKQYLSSFVSGALSGGVIGGVGGGINIGINNSKLREVGEQINTSGNTKELVDYAKNNKINTDRAEKLYGKSSYEEQLMKLAEDSIIEEQKATAATDAKYQNNIVNTALNDVARKVGLGQKIRNVNTNIANIGQKIRNVNTDIANRRSNLATGQLYSDVNKKINDNLNSSVTAAVKQKLIDSGISQNEATQYAQLISKAVDGTITENEKRVITKNKIATKVLDDVTSANQEILTAMSNRDFSGLSDNAIRYFEAVAPALAEGAVVSNFTTKRNITVPKVDTENKTIENNIFAVPTATEPNTSDLKNKKIFELMNDNIEHKYGDAGEKSINKLVEDYSEDESQVRRLFDEYYTAGALGTKSIDDVRQEPSIDLSQDIQNQVKQWAFAAGLSDYHAGAEKNNPVKAVRKGGVTVSESVSTELADEEVVFLDSFAKKLGVEIKIVPEVLASGLQAEGKYDNGVLYLSNKYIKDGLWTSIFSHELGHHLSEIAPEQWRNYKRFVIENMQSNPSRYNEILFERKLEYKQVQANIIDMEIMEEIACDTLELFLYDAKFTKEVIEQDRSFVEKVRDWLKNFIAELTVRIEKVGKYTSSRVLNNIMQQRDTYTQGLALVESLLEQGAETVQSVNSTDVAQTTEITENETKKSTANNDGEKYSLPSTQDEIRTLRTIGRKSINDFTSDEIQIAEKWARKFWNDIGVKSPFFRSWFGDWRAYDNSLVTIATKKGSNRVLVKNNDTDWDINVSRKVFNETSSHIAVANKIAIPYLNYIEDIIKNAVLLDTFAIDKAKSENSLFMHSFYALADIGNGRELLKLYVEEMNDPNSENTSKRAYQLKNIEKQQVAVTGSQMKSVSRISQPAVINTVSDLFSVVKSKDVNFSPNEANKAFLNKDGSPIIFYHGTNADFTVFDRSKSTKKVHLNVLGDGNYFVSKKSSAERYGENIVAVYIKINNPYIFYNDTYNTVADQISAEFNIDRSNIKGDKVQAYLKNKGFDGVITLDDDRTAVLVNAFGSNQIKSATDNIGTFDERKSDIRYSLPEIDVEFIGNEAISEKDAQRRSSENDITETIYNLIKIEKPSQDAIYNVSRQILSKTSSRMSIKKFAEKLTALIDYIEEGDVDIDSIKRETKELAKDVISLSEYTDDDLNNQYKDVRKQILRKTMYVNQADIGVEDIKQAALLANRRFYITTDKTRRGTVVADLDEVYEDLHNNYAEFFPESMSPMEQIENIAVFLDTTARRVTNPYSSGEAGMSEELAAEILTGEIYNTVVTGIIDRSKGIRYVDITNAKSVASKYYEAIEELKEQAAAYNEDYKKFAKEQMTKTAIYRELSKKKVEEQKAEIRQGAERRQTINSLKRLYKDSVNLLLGKRNDRLGTPGELKAALFDILELVNLQNGMYPGSKYNDRILSMRTRIHNMRDTLVKMKTETDAEGNEIVSEYAVDTLEALKESTDNGKKTIDQLSTDELRNLVNALKHVKGLVVEQNKLFTSEQKDSYKQLGESVITELMAIPKDHLGGTNSIKTMLTVNQLMPEYFFERIGGTLEHLFKNIYNTEGEQFRILQRFVADASKIANKHNFAQWGLKETKLEYETSQGKKMNIDIFNIMSLYALYKREKSNANTLSETNHIIHGGKITFTEDLGTWKEAMNNGAAAIRNMDSKKKFVRNKQQELAKAGKGDSPTKTYFLSEDDVKKIIGLLDDKQKAFADDMIQYLSNDVAAVGNEASRKMFNHDIFLEKCYFPMSVNKAHLATNIDANTAPKQVVNASMTKHVSTFADTAIVIRSFMDTWIEHVNQMSVYAATAPTLKDFMRVYNYKTSPPVENKSGNVAVDESERQNQQRFSVKELIEQKFGKEYTEYIEELMRDLNGGYRTVNEFGPLINNAKKTAVALSLSCAIQQPTAMARAFSILDVKNFAKYSKKGYDEMMKYSAVAQIKDTSGYDTLSGPSLLYEIVNHDNDEKFAQSKMFIKSMQEHNWKMASQFADEFFFYLPKKMDEITWTAIWNSCKKQVKSKEKYKAENEAFFNEVTKLFEEVIRKTQVYDSTFQKSGNLRSKNPLMNMEMSFMTEPTISYNMLLDAKRKYQFGDKRAATRIVTSVAVASVCAVVLKSFISAVRKIEKDEDAEDFLNRWFDLSIDNGFSDFFGYLPIVKDVYSLWSGYSIERMEYSSVEKLVKAIKAVYERDSETLANDIVDLGAAIGNIFGAPGTTIVRGIRSTINVAHNICHIADTPYTSAMIEATMNGDSKTIEELYTEQVANGLTKTTILKQYRQSMADNIPEVSDAAQLIARGDESAYYKKCRELMNMGFDYSDIKASVQLVLDSKTEKQNASPAAKAVSWIQDAFNFDYIAEGVDVPDEYYNSTFSDMVEAVQTGDTSGFTEMYNQLLTDGYTESQVKSNYREAMSVEIPEIATAAEYLQNNETGKYSIAIGEIAESGFSLTDVKSAVNKYLADNDVGVTAAEKFAIARISSIGTDIADNSNVFAEEELFDGAIYDYDMLYAVMIEQGVKGNDYKKMYDYLLDNGKSMKSIQSAMDNRAEKTVKSWINAQNAGDYATYEACLKELSAYYGSQSKAVREVQKYRTEQNKLIKNYINASSDDKITEAKEALIDEFGDWNTASKAIEYYKNN